MREIILQKTDNPTGWVLPESKIHTEWSHTSDNLKKFTKYSESYVHNPGFVSVLCTLRSRILFKKIINFLVQKDLKIVVQEN